MPQLSLNLFGRFGAMLDGEPVHGFESNKVRALLAYLALEAAQPHSREALVGLLWPEYPERKARQSLSQALYNLKHLLGENGHPTPFLHITHPTVQFNLNSDHAFDVTAFSEAIQQVDHHEHLKDCAPCQTLLTQATRLYTGPFLEAFNLKDSLVFEEWALLTRERLHRQALHAFLVLATMHETRGELPDALQYARRAVELDPLWEAAHRQVIHLLALSGQRTQALAQYESLRLTLASELGVEPEHETQQLMTRLQTLPAVETAPPPKHNLPAFLTPFIGREAELVDLTARLRDPDCRLLTVLGPGGSGKTRFAIAAAHEVMDTFPDGVWFVSLAAVTTREGVIPALVQGLGIYLQENIPAEKQIQDYLREKSMLLVLDNYEQLLPEVAWLVQILQTAPHVKLLVTSRMSLNIKGEHHYPLPGLSVPQIGETLAGARHSAIRLFADAAERAWPAFRLTSENLPAVVDICRTVEGLPLGIILAAAWVGTYREAEILTEMRRDLDFLATTWADVPARQRSLRATFAYSWRLLTDEERAVMGALSVFQGGFTREAAREICGATPRVLLSLSHKSLVQPTPNGRFYLHELVRQFAEEQLQTNAAGAQAVRTRHSRYFLKKLKEWDEGLKGPRQKETLEMLDVESSNARAAWDWAVETADWEPLAEGLEGLGRYYLRRERDEEGMLVFRSARIVLERHSDDTHPILPARLRMWECWFLLHHKAPEEFEHQVRACHAMLEDLESSHSEVNRVRAYLGYLQGLRTILQDVRAAKNLFLQSYQLAQSVDDSYLSGLVLLKLCECFGQLGLHEKFDTFTQRALDIQRHLGNVLGTVEALRHRAAHLFQTGHLDEAIAMEEEALALADRTGVLTPGWAGTTYLAAGQVEKALAHYKKEFAQRILQGNQYLIAASHMKLGGSYLWAGDYEATRHHLGTALDMYQKYNDPRFIAGALVFFGMLELVAGQTTRAFEAAQKGMATLRAKGLVAEYKLFSAFLACAGFHVGDSSTMQEAVLEELVNSTQVRHSPFLGWGLAAAALIAVENEQFVEAVSSYTAAQQYPTTANAHFTEIAFGKPVREAAQAHLTPEEIAEAEARGRACDPFEVAQELIARYSQT